MLFRISESKLLKKMRSGCGICVFYFFKIQLKSDDYIEEVKKKKKLTDAGLLFILWT